MIIEASIVVITVSIISGSLYFYKLLFSAEKDKNIDTETELDFRSITLDDPDIVSFGCDNEDFYEYENEEIEEISQIN